MKSNFLEELYVLLVIIVISPTENNEVVLQCLLHLAGVAHQVFSMNIDALRENSMQHDQQILIFYDVKSLNDKYIASFLRQLYKISMN